jgi:hypothetical protein
VRPPPVATVGDLLKVLLAHPPETPLGVVFFPADEWNPNAITSPLTASLERRQRCGPDWERAWGPRWFDPSDSVCGEHARAGGPVESVLVLDRVKK